MKKHDIRVEHRGYVLTQSTINDHYMITDKKTGRFVMHAAHDGELTEEDAKQAIDDYIHFRNGDLEVVLDPGAYLPERANPDDAGLDLCAPEECYIMLHPGSIVKINTGVHVAIPQGHVGKIEAKSSHMAKHGILTAGTIDSGYTGSIHVVLFNLGKEPFAIIPSRKIAQLVIYPIITPEVVAVDKLKETERGDGGFGSTGAMAKEGNDGKV